ncbi:MAG: TlpA family protein disulfide reductase, partial [Anaerolinea sp.]|nr:TlpA family protein disulfide reductase [Anaerolinea sp.]
MTPTPVIIGAASTGGFGGAFVGQLAPDFTLPTLEGDLVTLSKLRGQPILINLWASWCPPCRLEMPLLINVYQRY